MKILKRILLGLVALVVLLLVIGLFLPSKWKVERSVTIATTPEAIAPLIATPRRWADWAAWNNQMDPTLVTTYGGPETGVGASMTWKGENMGQGTMTITSVTPTSITYELVLEENKTPAHGTFSLSVEGDKTRVTWVDEGDMGMFIPGRYFRPLLEKMLGEHFDLGLKKLAPLAESEAKGALPPAAPTIAAAPAPEPEPEPAAVAVGEGAVGAAGGAAAGEMAAGDAPAGAGEAAAGEMAAGEMAAAKEVAAEPAG